ncbi:MAG: GH3 auxin-responsive promoter family protein, partial [Mucinivorans sp.]
MQIVPKIVNAVFAARLREIEFFRRQGVAVQQSQLQYILSSNTSIEYFAGHAITNYELFKKSLPVVTYEEFSPWIERVRQGQVNLLSRDATRFFAKSSGTTNSQSKYIPINGTSLSKNHMQGGRDVLAVFSDNFPRSRALGGKSLTLGGAHRIEGLGRLVTGDLSAILIENTPWYFASKRIPCKKIALEGNFQRKVELICQHCLHQDVTNFAGVPSWNLVLMNRILEYSSNNSLLDVWPNLSLFVHGGISFTPYRSEYERIIPSSDMVYMETYNASEGFFALADDPSDSSMLLMLDIGVFYEFRDMVSGEVLPLEGVVVGRNYAMIITTVGGLWRYMIGDTVVFSSVSPYKIRISGRTKHYINAFGEELIVDNAEHALQRACQGCGVSIVEYTAAPVFMEAGGKGSHEWFIEFVTPPQDEALFIRLLDETLIELNSDYAAKRFCNSTLLAPSLRVAPKGTFYRWMHSRGKVGGQNKVPRLFNTREYVEQLQEFVSP